ncbi:SNF2 domain-containing protein ENL1-like [Lolium perenne]|uniref:SNF2 domain-containing protein ENL1-like n=1 Tax=Lolium perenne TaxID=4522 RepID=UPI003A9975AD
MDESLREHIEFLEQQGIAGVSHHSLLFSKTEMLPMLSDNDALGRGADAKKTDEFFAARTNTNSDIPEEINCLTETLASATLESEAA